MENHPLEHYSSLQQVSLTKWMGLSDRYSPGKFFVQYNFNIHTPLKFHPEAYFIFHAMDTRLPPYFPTRCFSIENFNRWRLDIAPYSSVEEYHKSLIRWHRCNYAKSQKLFTNYGCRLAFIEGDWSEHVEDVNRLYNNVAKRYGHWLYDLNFFREIATRPDYSLLCAWFEGEMIGVFVLEDEKPTLHSILCGFDYHHSSASYAYSWMHYALIDQAISVQKFESIDVGLSADEAKKAIGFKPVPTRLDLYCKGKVVGEVMRSFSRFFSTSITPQQKLKFHWK